MKRYWLTLFFIASTSTFAACSGAEGPRLVAVGYNGGRGAVVTETTRDQRLQTDCIPALADDRIIRCLPAESASLAYADPSCQEPLIGVGDGSNLAEFPALVTGGRVTGVDRPVSVYRIGPRYSGEVFLNQTNGCIALSDASRGLAIPSGRPGSWGISGGAYRRLERVKPETFVELEVSEEPFAPGVLRTAYRTRDGFTIYGEFRDSSRGTPCVPVEFDGAEYCGPRVMYNELRFEDSTCDERGALALSSGLISGELPPLVLSRLPCGELELVEVGPPIAPGSAPYYRRTYGPGCEEDFAGEDLRQARIVEPQSVLPRLERESRGNGRLQTLLTKTPDGRARFFDTERVEPCSPFETEGVLRCVPMPAAVWTMFLDAACTEPVDVALDLGFAERAKIAVQEPTNSTGPLAFFELGAPIDRRGLFALSANDDCVALEESLMFAVCRPLLSLGPRIEAERLAPIGHGVLR